MFVVKNLAQYGVISDIPSFETPPNAWTYANNVSFENGGITKAGNRTKVMTPSTDRVNKIYNKEGNVYYTTNTGIYKATSVGNVSMSNTTFVSASEWFISELSNVLVFANAANMPQALIPNAATTIDLTGWDSQWRTSKIRSFKNFLLALGTTENGTTYNQRVRWSDLAMPNALPTTWDASDTTKSAGFNDLSEAHGEIVDGLAMGDYFMLYTSKEVYIVSYTGGNDIFSFRKAFDNVAILAPECVCAVNGGHFLVTGSDIIIHNGSSYQSIVSEKIKQLLLTTISNLGANTIKVQNYPAKSEVWVIFPSSKDGLLDKAAIYNLNNGTWTFRDLPNITAINYGRIPSNRDRIIDTQTMIIDEDTQIIDNLGQDFIHESLLVSTESLEWWAIDEGSSGEDGLPCTVYKLGMDFDDVGLDATSHKQVKAIYPQFKGNGVVYISVGVADNPYDAPTWTEGVPFDIAKDRKADFRTTGRYISLKFDAYDKGQWSLTSLGMDVSTRGRR